MSFFLRLFSDNAPENVARRITDNEAFGPSADDLQRLTVQLRKPKATQKILAVFDQRLQQRSRHWRSKSKTLTVIQHFIVSGNADFIQWTQARKSLVEKLINFEYIDSNKKDKGQSVRDKAQSILELINDPKKLEQARKAFKKQRYGVRNSIGAGRPTASRSTLEAYRESIVEDSDDDIYPVTSRGEARGDRDEFRDLQPIREGPQGLGVIQEEH